MTEGLKACAGFVLEMAVFFLFGSLLMRALKMKRERSLALVLGYLLYFSVFEAVTVPMVLTLVPLKGLCIVWGILLAAVCGLALFFLRRDKEGAGITVLFSGHSFWLLPAAAAVLFQCAAAVLYQDTTADAAYYVGLVSTSVYTGTLERYNPYTGALLKYFEGRYVFSAYPMHNAVWCKYLSLHPMVQSKVVMSAVNVLMANLVIYQIGKRLFHGGKRQADLMVCLVCVMQLFSFTIYTPGTFLFTRGYEGKALLANIIFPMVLYCSLWFYQEGRDRRVWAALFLVCAGAACFSGSSVILPAAVSAGILPVLLARRQLRALAPFAVSLLPSLIYAGLYFGTRMGWLAFPAS